MGIGVGTLVAGLFGMNVRSTTQLLPASLLKHALQLKSHIEDNDFGFFAMSVLSMVVAGIFSWVGLRR